MDHSINCLQLYASEMPVLVPGQCAVEEHVSTGIPVGCSAPLSAGYTEMHDARLQKPLVRPGQRD